MPGPANENNASALEELRQRLYANAAPAASQAPAPTPTPVQAPVLAPWQEVPIVAPKQGMSLAVKFFIGAIGVFVLALGVAAYFLIFGGGTVSTDNIEVSVAPTPSVRSGEVAQLLVTVKNNNPTTITNTRLSVTFPDSARDATNPTLAYPRFDDTLGDIPPGETRTKTIPVALSGAAGEVQTLPLKVEYKTTGSNATFVKEGTHEVTITSSPLSVKVVVPAQAAAGQELTLQVIVHSDATVPMDNIAVLAEYPFGFIPSKNSAASALFDVGTLQPGADATVTVQGTLTGEDTDQRVFRFKVGTKGVGSALGLTYATGEGSSNLSHPFLATTFTVNNSSGTDLVIPASGSTEARLTWVNTLPTDITDAQVTVALSGTALDPSSVTAQGGFYRSVDSTIVYAKDTTNSLARLAPDTLGNGSFSFATKVGGAMDQLRNPFVTAVITVTGRNSKDGNAPTLLTSSMARTIKVGTDFALSARSVRTTGPFKNTGPIPPQANVESTYTMLLSLTSSVNSVAGASVRAVLPSYVRFVGTTSPNDGSITYDPNSRSVTWAAGEVAAGTKNSPKQGAFQVALLPSTTQRGTSPVLMSSITYTGTDRFTRRTLGGTAPDVSTQTVSDPAFQGTQGEVAR